MVRTDRHGFIPETPACPRAREPDRAELTIALHSYINVDLQDTDCRHTATSHSFRISHDEHAIPGEAGTSCQPWASAHPFACSAQNAA